MTDLEGQEVELENTGSEAEPLSLNLSDADGTLSGTFTISGLDAGSYLLFVTVKLPDGNRTAVDAMRLLPGVDAAGSLTVVSMNDGDVADEGLTVDDLVGDLLEFSDLDGTIINIMNDPDELLNGELLLNLPNSYSYDWYIDGNEWDRTQMTKPEPDGDWWYQILDLNTLSTGRHVLTVVAYRGSANLAVGSVDIILDKLEVGLEKNIFEFELDSDGQSYAVTGIKDGMSQEDPEVLEIPSTYMGLPVTKIGERAFYNRSDITGKVINPDSVTSIENSAFSGCSGLTSVDIPNSVTSIGSRAFSRCSALISIDIPDSVTKIDYYVFQDCTSLLAITLPEGLKSIGEGAFSRCSALISIDIPDGVTLIGGYAFQACRNLTSIDLPEGLTSIGGSVFVGCNGLTSIIIPDGVTSIGSNAFQACRNLTSITLPKGLMSIGQEAFYECSGLISITIPESVTKIGKGAFYLCNNLTSVDLPEGLTKIDASTFYGCRSLTSVDIPDGVTLIGEHAFSHCPLTDIIIPDNVISIGKFAFMKCSKLSSIFIPDSVIETGTSLFNECLTLSDIYCEASAQPEGWDSGWLGSCNADVFRGVSRSDYDSIIAGTFDVAEPVIASTTDGNTCSITSDTTFAHIYYTTDGSEPTTENGTLYDSPFAVEEGKTVKAVAYVGNDIYSDVVAMEALQQLPTPTLTSRYDGSVYRVYLNNAADYPEDAQVYFRYICDELDPDPGFTLRGYASEFNELELYDTGGFNTGTAECYIVCEGYQQSETASLQLEEKQQLPTPELSYMHRDKELVIINYESYFDYDYSAGDEVLFMGSYEELEDSGSYEGAYLSLNDYSEGSAGLSDIGFDAGIDGTFYVRATCLSGDYKDSDIAVYTHSIDN